MSQVNFTDTWYLYDEEVIIVANKEEGKLMKASMKTYATSASYVC